MPTGYTDKIKPGVDYKFAQFALDCARAFGACIMLRDEPGGGERIPDKFEPSTYHRERIASDEAELARLRAMTSAELRAAAQADYDRRIDSAEKAIEEHAAQREAYEAMLSQVRDWQTPSEDHDGLKRFMIEQIEGSIRFDCGDDYYREQLGKPGQTAHEYRETREKALLDSIAYHRDGDRKEREQAEARTKWVGQLREALGQLTGKSSA